MKKLKTALVTCLCLCFALMGGTIFVACNQKTEEEINPYIKVSGLSTACVVGDELDYSNAKILYYINLTDETPDTYPLTRDMVTGFSSDETGTRTLKVNYKIYTTEMDYKIISENDFIQIYNNAYNQLMHINNAHININAVFDDENISASALFKNKEMYLQYSDEFSSREIWTIKEGDCHNCYNTSDNTKREEENYNPMNDYLFEGIFLGDDIKFNSTNFDEKVSNYKYQKVNGIEILRFNYVDEYFEYGNVLSCKFIIKDGQFEHIACVMNEDNSTTNISYDVTNEVIPALPENVEFELEDATEVISAYNEAIENLNNEDAITCSYLMNGIEAGATYYNGEVIYMNGGMSQRWYYEDASYWIEAGENTKFNETNNLSELILYQILGYSGLKITEEDLADASCTVRFDGNSVTYKIVYSEEYTAEITIENGLITKVYHDVYQEGSSMQVESNIIYTVDESNIVELPKNITWKEE